MGFIVDVTFKGPEAKIGARSSVPFAPSLNAHLDMVLPSVAHFNAANWPITANIKIVSEKIDFTVAEHILGHSI